MWPWLIKVGGWAIRLFGGWLPIGTKPVSEWLGKILWVIGIIAAVNIAMDFFKVKSANTSRPTVIALPFSKVDNVNQSTTQKSEEIRKKWWQPIPYISIAGEAIQWSSGISQAGAKVEAGLRWDF